MSTEVKPGTLGTLRHKTSGKRIHDAFSLGPKGNYLVIGVAPGATFVYFPLTEWELIPASVSLPTGIGAVIRFPLGVVAIRADGTNMGWRTPNGIWYDDASLVVAYGPSFDVLFEGVTIGE